MDKKGIGLDGWKRQGASEVKREETYWCSNLLPPSHPASPLLNPLLSGIPR